MTAITKQIHSATSAETARAGWLAGGRRRVALPFVLVAVISLAVGAGATWLALRLRSAPARAAAATEHAGQTAEAGPAPPPASASAKAIYISPARQQLIGVRTDEVAHRALESTIRTVGTLAYDETRISEVHTKVAGWVERVYVDFIGKPVGRGQPLLSMYSPDLVSTQKEYLLALKAQAQLAGSQFEETRTGAQNLVAAARERLRLWDISEAQIAELERTGQARRTLTLHSPFKGIVLERNTYAGQYLSPEVSAVRIADLSTIWAIGEIFEYELPRVALGQQAAVEFPYTQASRALIGKITFVYPDVDPQTRRAKVRIEFRNPGLTFKPGSYVTIVIKTRPASELAVPAEAVIDAGETQYTILALADGYFEPRRIKVGAPIGEFYPVIEGLTPGDRVVTSAQFLVDSETNLKAALQSMAAHAHDAGNNRERMEVPARPGAEEKNHSRQGQTPEVGKEHSTHR